MKKFLGSLGIVVLLLGLSTSASAAPYNNPFDSPGGAIVDNPRPIVVPLDSPGGIILPE